MEQEPLKILDPQVPLMTLQVVGVSEVRSVVHGAMTGPDRVDDLKPSSSTYTFLDVRLPCGTVATVLIDRETFDRHIQPALERRGQEAQEAGNG